MSGLSFAHPALLLGAAAAIVPVVIHLLMRPRPRRIRFPALTLLRATLASARRAQRVRNWLLLVCRVLILTACAVLLAGPSCEPAPPDPNPEANDAGHAPATVVVLDDSISTQYATADGRGLDDRLRETAVRIIDAVGELTPGATTALVRSGGNDTRTSLGPPSAVIESMSAEPQRPPNALPLGRALVEAGGLLGSTRSRAKRLIVVTDLAAHAWRDVSPSTLGDAGDVSVTLVGPTTETRTNVAITTASEPARLSSRLRRISRSGTIQAFGQPFEGYLSAVALSGAAVRIGPIHVDAAAAQEVGLELTAGGLGPDGAVLSLEPMDRMACDQKRFIVWETAAPPRVWLLLGRAEDAAEDTGVMLLQNLLAPADLPDEEQLVDLEIVPVGALAEHTREVMGSSEAGEGQARRPALVIAPSGVSIPAGILDALLRLVESGSIVLLAPASSARDPEWPELQRLLSEAAPTMEVTPDAIRIRWEPEFTDPSARDGLLELGRCTVRRRVRLPALAPDARVVARYDDGLPAIVQRRIGRGRVVLLTTNPDPRWSELGTRAAGLLTWLHVLIDAAVGPPASVAAFTVGEKRPHRFGALPESGLVSVTPAGESAAPSGAAAAAPAGWIRLNQGVPTTAWPTPAAGIYRVRAPGPPTAEALYAVNWPSEESDLTPATAELLQGRLGSMDVAIMDLSESWRAAVSDRPSSLARWLEPGPVVAAALLLVFIAEVLLANRRRVAA